MYLSLFDYLPADLVQASTHLDLLPDQVLYRRGEKAENIFLVEHGRLRLFSLDAEGRAVPLYVVRQGECVSEAALFAEVYCSDVTAEIRSQVRCFPKDHVLDALHKHSEFSARYMAEMARRFNSLRVRLELRNLKSARERVLQYLLSAAPVGGDTILIDRPLKSIADDLGLSPESFYRALALLAAQGVLARKKTCYQAEARIAGLAVFASIQSP